MDADLSIRCSRFELTECLYCAFCLKTSLDRDYFGNVSQFFLVKYVASGDLLHLSVVFFFFMLFWMIGLVQRVIVLQIANLVAH